MTPAFEGSPRAKICLVGEAPSAEEMRQGRPFVGPAGRVLSDCLTATGLDRGEVYITNVFDEPVRKNKETGTISGAEGPLWTQTRGLTEEGLAAASRCIQRLQASSANIVVALGTTALSLIDPSLREGRSTWSGQISHWRGSVWEAGGRKVMATYHPANVVWGATENRHVISNDLRRAREQSAFPEIRRKHREMITQPKMHEILYHLALCEQAGRFWFDIELFNGQLSALSFTCDSGWALSIPFMGGPGEHIWDKAHELRIIQRVATVLENPAIAKGNQNILFDIWALAWIYGIKTRGQLDDPMVLHSIVFPDFPKTLAFQASWLTDLPYWKDDGGKQLWRAPWENLSKFWRYSCLDSIAALECFEHLAADYLGPSSPYGRTYRETMELVDPLTFMMLRGVRIDQEGLWAARIKVGEEMKAALARCAEAGLANPNSPKQCNEFFGVEGADKFALGKIARAGGEKAAVAADVLAARRASKLLSNYLDMPLINGRMYCSYGIRGTNTGRLSSSKSVLGVGGNMQNLTAEFLTHVVPDGPTHKEG